MSIKDARILVVDDFSHTRSLLRSFLAELGYFHVEEAIDGDAAWIKIEKSVSEGKEYACIFSDWNMPRMSGLELLQKCRTHVEIKKVPFVLLTVESEKEFVLRAIQEGVTDYIIKPFTLQNVRERITKIEARWAQSA